MTLRYIRNRDLKAELLPAPGADWSVISKFALTFNGYTYCATNERYAEVTGARRQSTLSELRTLLFHEQRRSYHCGVEPTSEEMIYIESLMEQIRLRVRLAAELLR